MEVLWIILAVAGGFLLVIVAAAAFLWWKVYTSEEKRMARRIARLRFGDKLSLAASLFRDARVPLTARVVAALLVLYLATPLDILPDFLPVVGYLDDLLIVLVGAAIILRSIPPEVLEEHVARYEERRKQKAGGPRKVMRAGRR